MRKVTSLALAAVFTGVGLLVWRYAPTPSAPSVSSAVTTDVAKTPEAHASSPAEQAASAVAPTSKPKSAVPAWEERLNRLVNLVGKVPEGELDTEIEDLAATLPHDDALAVLNLQLLPGADNMPIVSKLCTLLIQRWAERAPAAAAEWLARVPEGAFSQSAHRRVAGAWAEANLAEALAWLKNLPENTSKPGAQLTVAWKAADQREAVTAIELLSVLPPQPERDRLLNYSAQVWATKDREASVAWVNKLENPAQRERLLQKITIDWAVTEPAQAAAFAVTSLPPGKAQEKALATSVTNWAVVAPAQAADWVQQISEGALRNTAMRAVAEVWAKDDSAKAAEWLNQLPAGPSRDAAVGMFASTVATKSPEQAAKWAATIQDQTLRSQVLGGLGRM